MFNELMNLLIVIVVALLAVALPVLYQRMKVWVEKQFQTLPQNVREALSDAALIAARFVEQLGLTDQLREGIEDLASEKMNMAVDYGKQLLAAQGYKVTSETDAALRALIENVILAGLHKKNVAQTDSGVMPPGVGDPVEVDRQVANFPITSKRLEQPSG